jgi:hypothetical protein
MRSLRTLTAALMASAMMIGPAFAHRSWFMLDYTDAQCHVSEQSPQAVYDAFDTPLGHMQGVVLERIAPNDVIKDANGDIQVNISGTRNGDPIQMHFFTSFAACKQYVIDNSVTPEEADKNDIN